MKDGTSTILYTKETRGSMEARWQRALVEGREFDQ
jgi:hypothetical protein